MAVLVLLLSAIGFVAEPGDGADDGVPGGQRRWSSALLLPIAAAGAPGHHHPRLAAQGPGLAARADLPAPHGRGDLPDRVRVHRRRQRRRNAAVVATPSTATGRSLPASAADGLLTLVVGMMTLLVAMLALPVLLRLFTWMFGGGPAGAAAQASRWPASARNGAMPRPRPAHRQHSSRSRAHRRRAPTGGGGAPVRPRQPTAPQAPGPGRRAASDRRCRWRGRGRDAPPRVAPSAAGGAGAAAGGAAAGAAAGPRGDGAGRAAAAAGVMASWRGRRAGPPASSRRRRAREDQEAHREWRAGAHLRRVARAPRLRRGRAWTAAAPPSHGRHGRRCC